MKINFRQQQGEKPTGRCIFFRRHFVFVSRHPGFQVGELTEDVLKAADDLAARGGGGGGVAPAPGDDPRGRREGGVRVLHEGEPVADAVHRADLRKKARHLQQACAL